MSAAPASPAAPVDAFVPQVPLGRERWPRTTVAILAYNRREELRETLSIVLGRLDYPAESLEVIVVDNASTDGTAAMLAEAFPSVRLIALDKNVGAPAWNAAFAEGSGEWFLVLDDDCYLGGPNLKLAVAAAEANRADLVSFKVRSSYDPDYYFNDEFTTGILSFWGCAWLISRRALDAVGGYDPGIFIWGNEVDLTLRVLDAGYRHLYLPDVVAVHMKPPAPPGRFSTHAYRTNYSHIAYTVAKRLHPADVLRVMGRMVATVLVDSRSRTIPGEAVKSLPSMARFFGRGLRRRRPVRPEVSQAYRDNFIQYRNPLETVRKPWRRGTSDHWQRYFAARGDFFPKRAAVVEL